MSSERINPVKKLGNLLRAGHVTCAEAIDTDRSTEVRILTRHRKGEVKPAARLAVFVARTGEFCRG